MGSGQKSNIPPSPRQGWGVYLWSALSGAPTLFYESTMPYVFRQLYGRARWRGWANLPLWCQHGGIMRCMRKCHEPMLMRLAFMSRTVPATAGILFRARCLVGKASALRPMCGLRCRHNSRSVLLREGGYLLGTGEWLVALAESTHHRRYRV